MRYNQLYVNIDLLNICSYKYFSGIVHCNYKLSPLFYCLGPFKAILPAECPSNPNSLPVCSWTEMDYSKLCKADKELPDGTNFEDGTNCGGINVFKFVIGNTLIQ